MLLKNSTKSRPQRRNADNPSNWITSEWLTTLPEESVTQRVAVEAAGSSARVVLWSRCAPAVHNLKVGEERRGMFTTSLRRALRGYSAISVIVVGLGTESVAQSPRTAPSVAIQSNSNQTAAGKLKDAVLTLHLEVRQGDWYPEACLLYTSDAADDGESVDLSRCSYSQSRPLGRKTPNPCS